MDITRILSPVAGLVVKAREEIYRLRIKKLISRGLKVGKNVYINEDVNFDYNFPYLIEIGDDYFLKEYCC